MIKKGGFLIENDKKIRKLTQSEIDDIIDEWGRKIAEMNDGYEYIKDNNDNINKKDILNQTVGI